MPITIDESDAPLIRVTYVGLLTDDDVETYLRDLLRHVYARRQKTVTIFDLSRARMPTAAQRARQAEWLAANRDALQAWSIGDAFIVSSAVMRAALSAIFWMVSHHAPYLVASSLAEGESWARKKLREAYPREAHALHDDRATEDVMAQRGNRAKHVAGLKSTEEGTKEPEGPLEDERPIEHTAGGGGMGKTSPKDRKAEARSLREEERATSASEPGTEGSDGDFRTETVPGPGPRDTNAGRATTRQLETHELKERH